MMETDAGDFAINDSAAVAVAPKAQRAAGPQGPIFRVSPKLEDCDLQLWGAATAVRGADGTPPLGSPAHAFVLQAFIVMAKNAKGGSAANIVGSALSAPGVYVFSELLEIRGIRELGASEQHAPTLDLLEIFAYGTWGEYAAKRKRLPTLNEAQENKLKHLTILSLAMENRIIPYATLLATLDLPSIPVLEDLLIEAFYSNIMSGRLDQKEARLEISSGLGRDVRPSPPALSTLSIAATADDTPMELDNAVASASTSNMAHSVHSLTSALQNWLMSIGTILSSLDHHIGTSIADAVNETKRAAHCDQFVEAAVADIAKGKEKADATSWNMGAGRGKVLGGVALARGASSASVEGTAVGGAEDDAAADAMEVDDGAGGADADGVEGEGGAPVRGAKSSAGASSRTRKRGRM